MGALSMIKFLTNKISNAVLAELHPLILLLRQRNRLLIEQNKTLHKTNKEQLQTIATLKEALAIVKNTKPTDLAGNIKRLQDGEL